MGCSVHLSWQSVSKLNKDIDFMVAKQILCKTRVCVALELLTVVFNGPELPQEFN
jgi:hypothetical protein